jgi:pimeloyl-ACP methyl ester carboxylesterase
MDAGERFTVERPVGTGSDRIELVGWRWGTGPVRGVLLHAGVCDSRSWPGVVEHLRAGEGSSAVDDSGAWVAYDRRGFGETPYTPGPYSHLDDLLAVLDAIAGDVPVWLVGSSMGGGLALDAAISAPERIAGLVLIAPGVSGRPGERPTGPAVLKLWNAVEAADKAGDLAEVSRLETVIWLDGPAGGAGRVGGAARELALAMDLLVNQKQPMEADETAGPSGVDAWSRLGEIEVPVTVVWGDLDVEAAGVPAIVSRITGARSIELAGRAHLPYLEDPAQTATIVATALGVLPART